MNLQVFDFFMDGVLAIDHQGKVVYSNQKMAELLGASIVRIANKFSVLELLGTSDFKFDLQSFKVQYDEVFTQVVEYNSKFGKQGTALMSLIPVVNSSDYLGLIYLKDLSHEVQLDSKYKMEMASKDQKILEMQILLEMLSNSRFNKEPKLLLRQLALNLLSHFDFSWCLLHDANTGNLQIIEAVRGKRSAPPFSGQELARLVPYDGSLVETLIMGSPAAALLNRLDSHFSQFLVLRLSAHGKPSSNLIFPMQSERSLNPSEHELFRALLDQLSIALENAELQLLAVTDELTQVFNVRYFKANLIEQLRLAKKEQSQFSVLLFDVDHFKKINDRYGHLGGDLVLKSIGLMLKEFCRSADLPARYGGEEFAILLPQTSPEDAFRVAERLRLKIQQMCLDFQGQQIQFTASFGVSGYSSLNPMTLDEIIDRADKALYESKQQGRNKVSAFKIGTE